MNDLSDIAARLAEKCRKQTPALVCIDCGREVKGGVSYTNGIGPRCNRCAVEFDRQRYGERTYER